MANEWINEELKKVDANTPQGERLEALKLEDGKVMEFDVDFTKPFSLWINPMDAKQVRKQIYVTHDGVKKMWWLSPMNPTYREILKLGMEGKSRVKILRSGQGPKTRLTIVKD